MSILVSQTHHPFALIIGMDGFFGPIHGLIQVAHCGIVSINEAKNIFQRFANGTHLLHSHPKTLLYDTMALPFSLVLTNKACHLSERKILFTFHTQVKRDCRDMKLVAKCVIV
jgi:hypothetical protein